MKCQDAAERIQQFLSKMLVHTDATDKQRLQLNQLSWMLPDLILA